MHKFRGPLVWFLLSSAWMTTAVAQVSELNATVSNQSEPVLDYRDAVIYGLVEGLTEYLPVSSTGHLVLMKDVLDAQGSDQAMEALNAYLIVIQFGAILAVALLYRREVWSILLGLLGLDPRGRSLARNLVLAFLPAAILGPLLADDIDKWLMDEPEPVAAALFAGALLMFGSERMRKNRELSETAGPSPDLGQMRPGAALFIGLLQCIAMWPGTSRSMMTIVGGYLVGLRPAKAAEFSFLLGLVTLSAASGYKVLTKGEEMAAHLNLGPVIVGCLVAGVAAALSVHWLVGFLTRRGLGLFAWYRLVLATLVLVFV